MASTYGWGLKKYLMIGRILFIAICFAYFVQSHLEVIRPVVALVSMYGSGLVIRCGPDSGP